MRQRWKEINKGKRYKERQTDKDVWKCGKLKKRQDKCPRCWGNEVYENLGFSSMIAGHGFSFIIARPNLLIGSRKQNLPSPRVWKKRFIFVDIYDRYERNRGSRNLDIGIFTYESISIRILFLSFEIWVWIFDITFSGDSTITGGYRRADESCKVLMMMKAVSLAWAGTVEKIEQSGASVGVGQKIAGVVSSTVVVSGSPI